MVYAPHEWAYSSAGEHYIDIVGVTGSIPVTPTIRFKDLAGKRQAAKSSSKIVKILTRGKSGGVFQVSCSRKLLLRHWPHPVLLHLFTTGRRSMTTASLLAKRLSP